jgi:hypothetical protein
MNKVKKPSNSELHYCIFKNKIQDPIADEMNPFHTLIPYVFKIHFNITLSYTPRPSKWYPLFRLSERNVLRISSFVYE